MSYNIEALGLGQRQACFRGDYADVAARKRWSSPESGGELDIEIL